MPIHGWGDDRRVSGFLTLIFSPKQPRHNGSDLPPDIANRDLESFRPKILDYLSKTKKIIQNIIVPALASDSLNQNLNRHRDLSLAALNRLAPLLGLSSIKHSYISSLLVLLNDPSIDKKLLLSTLRCSGLEGKQLIVDLVTHSLFYLFYHTW
jgi:hypothetical protein